MTTATTSSESPGSTSTAVDETTLAAVADRLGLRAPNREAVRRLAQFAGSSAGPRASAVLDMATGAGKTYVIAGAVDYLAAHGSRDFLILCPGRIILAKTIANFTLGSAKSLREGMFTKPLVITSENFDTPAVRAGMDDPNLVKIYIFTVQALTRPASKVGRKTHEFRESLGAGLYGLLGQPERRLVVFADEWHYYQGPAFSKTITDIAPRLLVGLTATAPKGKTAPVIYRYPLGAAIADGLVKIPVIVGRRDDRDDMLTKLTDGARLLALKQVAADDYASTTGSRRVRPLMLVVAESIEDAEAIGRMLHQPEFARAGLDDPGAILVVTSDSPDGTLDRLAAVEEPSSPVRVIVSVGMLKEGWDVSTVFVIIAMRALISTVLTEQVLGRGLRLPWGSRTGLQFLDSVEVLAHESFSTLLAKVGSIVEKFVDDRSGAPVGVAPTVVTVIDPTFPDGGGAPLNTPLGSVTTPDPSTFPPGPVLVEPFELRADTVEEGARRLRVPVLRREGVPAIRVPRVQMGAVSAAWSVNDITDLSAFRELGRRLATEPEDELRRVAVETEVIHRADGRVDVEWHSTGAREVVESQGSLLPLEDLKADLISAIVASGVVPPRRSEMTGAQRVVDALVAGSGPDAAESLSAFRRRAATRLVVELRLARQRGTLAPTVEEVIDTVEFDPVRITDRVLRPAHSTYVKSAAFNGWLKSVYDAEWFDSSLEFNLARLLDSNEDVTWWVRLHRGELPIRWTVDGREYNADFIACDTAGARWIIEGKQDREMNSEEVVGKRQAAQRWINHVNSSDVLTDVWDYRLVGETDYADAQGSWSALVGLTRP